MGVLWAPRREGAWQLSEALCRLLSAEASRLESAGCSSRPSAPGKDRLVLSLHRPREQILISVRFSSVQRSGGEIVEHFSHLAMV